MKRLVLMAVVLGLLCACGASHSAAPQAVKRGATGPKGPTGRNASQHVVLPASVYTPHTKAAATREANRLLDAYVPPQGAVRLTAVPKGEHSPPGAAGGIFGKIVKRHRLWLVHLPTKAFMRYIHHRLHGWNALAYGSGRDCLCRAVTSTEATYGEVGFGGRATGRVLQLVAVKTHRPGWSLLRADVVVVWHLSAAEREDLPAGVRAIDIRGPHGKTSVTDPDQVRTIVRWFDHFQLDEAPFFVGSCGVTVDPHRLTFTFKGGYGMVAKAIVPDPSWGCSTTSYTIRGNAQTPLVAGEVDQGVQKLLGVKLLP